MGLMMQTLPLPISDLVGVDEQLARKVVYTGLK